MKLCILTICILAMWSSGCAKKATEESVRNEVDCFLSEIIYFQDVRTGCCFATTVTMSGKRLLTTVPCEKVPLELLGPTTKGDKNEKN